MCDLLDFSKRVAEADKYGHLDDPLLPFSLRTLADVVVSTNYGTHRFLCALLRSRLGSPKCPHPDPLAEGILALLEEGLY